MIGIKKVIYRILYPNSDFIKNVFRTNHDKRVLISYITAPFINSLRNKKTDLSVRHTNFFECLTAVQIFDSLGYIVDVITLNAKKKIDFSKYDVVYGMSINFEKSFDTQKKIKRIFYGTGCNPNWANNESLKKVRSFHDKTNIWAFSSARNCIDVIDKQLTLSDHIIVLGNDFTKQTYSMFDDKKERFSNLNCFFYNNPNIDIDKRDFATARKHLLWFGSAGALHKGLDLSIELALRHPDYVLHICGSNHGAEKEFWSYYEPIVKKSENIIDYGFVDLKSDDFHALMQQCAFAIFPSVSEGGSPALLTVMGNAGLIPLTSVRTGLDLPDYIPVLPEDKNELPEYERLLAYWETIPDTTLKTYSISLQKTISEKYSYENYKNNLADIIRSAIGI